MAVFISGAVNYTSKLQSSFIDSDLTIAVISHGLGRHANAVPTADQVAFFKLLLAFECIYVTAVMLVKLALSQMYLRIFLSRGFRVCAAVIAAIVVGWWIAIVAVSIFQCTPIKKAVPDGSFPFLFFSSPLIPTMD